MKLSKSSIGFLLTIVLPTIVVGQAQGQLTTPELGSNGTGTVVTPQDNRFNISGGKLSRDGANLFHSFEQFGLEQGQIANFLSNPQIQNILGRVVGGNPSVINGLIQVTGGNSNLFLMNPAGMIFGAGASLNVPASFTATTATGIGFGNRWFNATGANNYAALVDTPNTFAFTTNQPGSIINTSNLSVGQGRNLTLLGGTVVSTGKLSAPTGQVTVATVPGESLVRISQTGNLLSLDVRTLTPADSRPRNWTLPIASLPELLTGGGGSNATGLRVSDSGQVELIGSGFRVENGDVVVKDVTAQTAILSAAHNLLGRNLPPPIVERIVPIQTSPLPPPGSAATYPPPPDSPPASPPEFAPSNPPSSSPLPALSYPPPSPDFPKALEGEEQALSNVDLTHLSLGDYSQAIESYQPSLKLTQELGNHQQEAVAVGGLGRAYTDLGNYSQAIESYQQSLRLTRELGNRQQEAIALGSLGRAYTDVGNYSQAIESYQQSLRIALELGNRQQEGIALGGLGRAYIELGNYNQAIEYHKQSLNIARSLGNIREEGVALGTLGITYQGLSDYPRAIEYHQQHLTLARKITDSQGEAAALGNLGIAYEALGDYPKAIEYYQQHLTVARAIGNRQGEANAVGNLGNAYQALGSYVKAIEYHQQALAIKQNLGDRKGEAQTLGNLGNAYEALGDYTKARQYYEQTLATAQAISDRKTEGIIWQALGTIHTNLGEKVKAISSYQQSLQTAQAIGDRQNEGSTLGSLGFAYYVQRDYTKALEYSQQSLDIIRSIGDRRTEATVLGNIGLVYENLNDLPRAIEYHQQSLATVQAIADRKGEWVALAYLGNALFKAGNLPEAEKKLRTALEVLESLRAGLDDTYKVSIFDTQVSAYALLQQVLVAQSKPEAALEIAERGRARAFVELLTKRMSPAVAAKSTVNATPPTISQIQKIAQQQNATLVEYSIVPETFLFQGKLRGSPSQLFIWVIQPTGEVAFRQVDLKQLQQQRTSLKDLIVKSREFSGIRVRQETARKQLYQLLIEPIAELLPKNPDARVIFIPQDSLFLVPFPALSDASGQYLIEKHTLLTAPAIQVLELTHQQRQRLRTQDGKPLQGKNVLVVGNPTMPAQLAPLPGAEQEALMIAKLLNTKALIGNQATKVDIVQQLPNARLIHLATHGFLDDVNKLGLPGAIALAPSANDNGFLTSGEILNLKLNAELVVLSACDTGRGEITGDGVIGLSRTLISAGVPSAIVSLWAVPDASTSVLMSEFYRHFSSNPDKAQALRSAMLMTMKQYPNPVHWAAFTLIGEAE
jgi:filamentous hemagglutinin family protein